MATARAGQPAAGGRSLGAWLRIWFKAIRFFSFTASVVPIAVASALAVDDRTFDPWLGLAMLVAAVACHAGANLANDYYDHRRGIDTPASLGPSKVIQQGLLSPAAVKRGMVVAFALATLIGLAIVAAAGWPILLLALLSLAAAYLYTGGPKPLGYVALGEATVFLFMGPVMVLGAIYVYERALSLPAALLSLPIGLLVAAILHANNVRDIDLDHAAGKQTLATRFGRRAAAREYAALVYGAYAAVLALIAVAPALWPTLATLITVPMAHRLARLEAAHTDPPTLNLVLRKTAGLHLRFGLLLTAGLLAAAALARLA